MKTSKASLLAIGSVIAFAMTGCGGGGSNAPEYSAPRAQADNFTAWSKNAVFSKPAESTPEVMDSITFNFDSNEDPNAYAELLPPAL